MRKIAMIMAMFIPMASSCAVASENLAAPAAPPLVCELRLSTWCIAEGAYEITRRLAQDSVNDRIWMLRGRFKADSRLVILEPNGCKKGFSDELGLLGFDKGINWENSTWDQVKVRLKSDASCDLTILIPPYNGDPMDWAFSNGLTLVRPCKDSNCTGKSAGELRPQFVQRYQQGK